MAICHRTSDQIVQRIITSYANNFQNNIPAHNLAMQALIRQIDPAIMNGVGLHKGSDFLTHAANHHVEAFSLLQQIHNNPNMRTEVNYHRLGSLIANSPMNLFVGHSDTNSSIGGLMDLNSRQDPAAGSNQPLLTRQLTTRSEDWANNNSINPDQPRDLNNALTMSGSTKAKTQATIFNTSHPNHIPPLGALGSGLIDHIQKITVAAMQIADMKVCAHRS